MAHRRRRALKAAQRLLGPTAQVRAYATGRAQARMSTAVWVVLGAFVLASVTTTVLVGRVLLPGGVLFVLIYGYVRPYRGIAVTEAGIVLFDVSKFGGQASRPLAFFPYWALFPPPYLEPKRGRVRLHLGPDVITFRAGDHHRLLEASAPGAGFAPFAEVWRRPMVLKVFYGGVAGLFGGGLLAALLGGGLSSEAAGWTGFLVGMGGCIWLSIRLFARSERPIAPTAQVTQAPPGVPAA